MRKESKLVRLNQQIIDYVKSKSKHNESFDAALSRILGLNIDKNNIVKNQLARLPEVTQFIDNQIKEYVKQGLKRADTSYKEFYDEIKIEMENANYPKIYPQLFTKTKNGQLRLAHMVRTRVARLRALHWEKLGSKVD